MRLKKGLNLADQEIKFSPLNLSYPYWQSIAQKLETLHSQQEASSSIFAGDGDLFDEWDTDFAEFQDVLNGYPSGATEVSLPDALRLDDLRSSIFTDSQQIVQKTQDVLDTKSSFFSGTAEGLTYAAYGAGVAAAGIFGLCAVALLLPEITLTTEAAVALGGLTLAGLTVSEALGYAAGVSFFTGLFTFGENLIQQGTEKAIGLRSEFSTEYAALTLRQGMANGAGLGMSIVTMPGVVSTSEAMIKIPLGESFPKSFTGKYLTGLLSSTGAGGIFGFTSSAIEGKDIKESLGNAAAGGLCGALMGGWLMSIVTVKTFYQLLKNFGPYLETIPVNQPTKPVIDLVQSLDGTWVASETSTRTPKAPPELPVLYKPKEVARLAVKPRPRPLPAETDVVDPNWVWGQPLVDIVPGNPSALFFGLLHQDPLLEGVLNLVAKGGQMPLASLTRPKRANANFFGLAASASVPPASDVSGTIGKPIQSQLAGMTAGLSRGGAPVLMTQSEVVQRFIQDLLEGPFIQDYLEVCLEIQTDDPTYSTQATRLREEIAEQGLDHPAITRWYADVLDANIKWNEDVGHQYLAALCLQNYGTVYHGNLHLVEPKDIAASWQDVLFSNSDHAELNLAITSLRQAAESEFVGVREYAHLITQEMLRRIEEAVDAQGMLLDPVVTLNLQGVVSTLPVLPADKSNTGEYLARRLEWINGNRQRPNAFWEDAVYRVQLDLFPEQWSRDTPNMLSLGLVEGYASFSPAYLAARGLVTPSDLTALQENPSRRLLSVGAGRGDFEEVLASGFGVPREQIVLADKDTANLPGGYEVHSFDYYDAWPTSMPPADLIIFPESFFPRRGEDVHSGLIQMIENALPFLNDGGEIRIASLAFCNAEHPEYLVASIQRAFDEAHLDAEVVTLDPIGLLVVRKSVGVPE